MEKTFLTIEATIQAPIATVWKSWTTPADIMKWNSASDDWHTTKSENDLRVGGTFLSRMEAKDGSFGFDFGGTYTNIKNHELIEYTLGDGRTVSVEFTPNNDSTNIVSVFEAETQNPVEMQQGGWQAILNNFKKYTESL